MRYIVVFFAVLLAVGIGCSEVIPEVEDNQKFTFRVKKNGVEWKVNSAQGYRRGEDSTFYIQAWGQNNEKITFSFKREDPLFIGRLEEFGADVAILNCEHCAGIAALHSLDAAKVNRLEILGFDNIEDRILGKFLVNLKKDRLYDDEFIEEFNTYEGTFSLVYQEITL